MKKTQTMGLIFKIFWCALCELRGKFRMFRVFLWQNRKWVPFFEKKTKKQKKQIQVPIFGKISLNMGLGLELPAAHPWPIKI